MKITDIQSLYKADFGTYRNLLLDNQKHLLEHASEECIFISALSVEELAARIDATKTLSAVDHPLLGVPFAVKDNIDVIGFDTTAGCPAYSYRPQESAFAVKLLEEAGAICIGKTNMDQFATGLVGVRSPYGVARNYYNPKYIPGGSSSGSASAVAAGYAAFSLGTDTAGSGRVPAAFQGLIGVKPSRGIVSTTGVVPACRSLDCVSVFATELDDASRILALVARYDKHDVYSRRMNLPAPGNKAFKIAIPLKENLRFFGNTEYENDFKGFVQQLKQNGYVVEEVDFAPMFEAARLLYAGPWVAERYHAVGAFAESHPDAVLPVTKQIIDGGKALSALTYFDAEYRLKGFKKTFDEYAEEYAAFIMPTAGTIYTPAEVEADPIALNSNLGYYTNFMNLLDCAAIALPVAVSEGGLPFGVTAFAPAFNDYLLLDLGKALSAKGLLGKGSSADTDYIDLAVCGAHKRGGTLNYQLTEIGAVYQETTFTAPEYRLFALEHLVPPRPGLVKTPGQGRKIEVEIWKVPADRLGTFINRIGSPLGFGKVTLENGNPVMSFLCEAYAVNGAKEIDCWRCTP